MAERVTEEEKDNGNPLQRVLFPALTLTIRENHYERAHLDICKLSAFT